MHAYDLAGRLDARRVAAGWIARCPAHIDRTPSLRISEGRDGRILVRCFAGCEIEKVVDTLGLRLTDLFSDTQRVADSHASKRRYMNAAEIEEALKNELSRILAAESEFCEFEVEELTRHRNAAREVIERRYGCALKRERAPFWEVEPHALDPAWALCVAHAMRVAAERSGIRIQILRAAIDDLPKTRHRVLLTARRYLRELAQQESVAA